jgi:hypothetical protein
MAMTREESGTRAGFEIDLGMQCAGERVRNDAYSTDLAMYIIETRGRGAARRIPGLNAGMFFSFHFQYILFGHRETTACNAFVRVSRNVC